MNGILAGYQTTPQTVSQAQADARVLAHAYVNDSKPPDDVVQRALAIEPVLSFPTTPQPDPLPGDDVAVWDLVVQDMRARDRQGEERYGMRLRGNNGRDALVDAYQEALDLCVYLRQAILERDGR